MCVFHFQHYCCREFQGFALHPEINCAHYCEITKLSFYFMLKPLKHFFHSDLFEQQQVWCVNKQAGPMEAPCLSLHNIKDLLLASWCQIPQQLQGSQLFWLWKWDQLYIKHLVAFHAQIVPVMVLYLVHLFSAQLMLPSQKHTSGLLQRHLVVWLNHCQASLHLHITPQSLLLYKDKSPRLSRGQKRKQTVMWT